jgi:hypothetical protein
MLRSIYISEIVCQTTSDSDGGTFMPWYLGWHIELFLYDAALGVMPSIDPLRASIFANNSL